MLVTVPPETWNGARRAWRSHLAASLLAGIAASCRGSVTTEPSGSELAMPGDSSLPQLPAMEGGTAEAGASSAARPMPDAGPLPPAPLDAAVADGAVSMAADAGDVDAAAPHADLCDVGVFDGSPPRVLALTGATFAHDPTMIEVDGVFYRFWTGDHIPMATSTDLTHWRAGPSVYGGRYPEWVDGWLREVPGQTFNFPWAPDVSRFAGRFHIYSSFSARFGDNVSCISHLSSDDIALGTWTDDGPVVCTEGDERYNAIDADVALDTEGTPWLAFGSFWDGIMLARLSADGSRADAQLTRLAWAPEIEAPVLFRRCGYYYLFVTWGLCCPGEGRSVDQLSYRVAVGRAEDIRGPYVDRMGVPMLEGGGTLLVQGDAAFAAAGHSDVLVSGGHIYHVYHAYRRPRGNAELRIAELPFDDEGWPVPAGP